MKKLIEKLKSLIPVMKKYWWVILIVVILGGAFYWFQWRPSQIRKDCYKSSIKSAQKLYKDRAELGQIYVDDKQIEDGWYQISDFDYNYNACIISKGLEK